MALRARLVAPPPAPREVWPWHTVKWAELRASAILNSERRLASRNFLSTGYGTRLAVEARPAGWCRFEDLAEVVQVPRTKGIIVEHEHGTPFLIASQMFDRRPIVRKWLAAGKIEHGSRLFAPQGTIITRRSADVGRSTITCKYHEGHLISDHFFRIEPRQERDKGWLYAFVRSPQGRAMMTGSQYGHIIQHIEFGHVRQLPVPTVDDATAADFGSRVQRIVDLRNECYRLTLEAEARFESALGPLRVSDWGEAGFKVMASSAFVRGRRRFDASAHSPGIAEIRRHFERNGTGFTSVADAGYDVWVPGRYKRIPALDGVVYRDSADLLEVSHDLTKRFADCRFGDEFRGRVKAGWVLVPSSGQVYGIIGTAMLATAALNDQVVSNHVIRIAPRTHPIMRAGYLLTALSHPGWGRPLVKSLAFGSSVPEIASEDLAALELVRLKADDESTIADLAEASGRAGAEADAVEHGITADASVIIDRFIASRA